METATVVAWLQSQLLSLGRHASMIQNDILHITPPFRFFSSHLSCAIKEEAIILIAAIYYALIAFPIGRAIMCYWNGAKTNWGMIYLKSFGEACLFMCLMWVMYRPVSLVTHFVSEALADRVVPPPRL